MPQSPPYPYLFLRWPHSFLSPLKYTLVGFSVTIFLQQLSLSGSGVCCPQPPCSSPGKCAVSHRITVESREAHVSREWPLHMSFRETEDSIPLLPFSIPGISQESKLGSAGTCTASSALSLHPFLSLHGAFLITPGHMAESLYFMAPPAPPLL